VDAHSLRLQIDELLPIVRDRDPDRELGGSALGMLLKILKVVYDQYGSRLILDEEIWELLIERARKELPVISSESPLEPITAEQMQFALASVRASLLALEEEEEAHTVPYGPAATTEASSYWSPDMEGPGNWPEEPGDRRYRIVDGRQHRRTAVHLPRGLPL